MKRSILVSVVTATLSLLLVAVAPADARPAGNDCTAAFEACSATCEGLADRTEIAGCLVGCDTANSLCTGDSRGTLSSDEYLAVWGETLLFSDAAACNPTTTCPPEYGACTNWSGFSDCGDPFCGVSTACKICDPEWPYQCLAAGPALKQYRERYRVCFNEQVQGCVEYQRGLSDVGGCGC